MNMQPLKFRTVGLLMAGLFSCVAAAEVTVGEHIVFEARSFDFAGRDYKEPEHPVVCC